MDWHQKILGECIGEEPPPCQAACPLDIPVREKLSLLQAGRREEALDLLLLHCPFPGILGRICHHPCEAACTRSQVDESVAVAALKRHLIDLDPEAVFRVRPGPPRPERLAVVGGGPAGLMCALELRRRGFGVTLFEAEAALGGALRLYIPAYRLPREVLDREVAVLDHLGVEILLNRRLGRDLHLDDLRAQYAAVFLALGSQRPLQLPVPGADLPQVMDALAFLRAANRGEAPIGGGRLAVIGGGNVAVDAARQARRLGAGEVTVISLETAATLPAFPEEVAAAKEEGVNFHHGLGVQAILAAEGRVQGLRLMAVVRVFDEAGRFAPLYDTTRLTEVPADQVILAVGQEAEWGEIFAGLPSPAGQAGPVRVDPLTLATHLPGVFAGGDCVTGPRSAVEAFAAGRRAAWAMEAFLSGKPPAAPPPLTGRDTGLIVTLSQVPRIPRVHPTRLAAEARLKAPRAEVVQGLAPAQAAAEAGRCLRCTCSECVKNCTFLKAYVQDFPATEKGLARLLAAGSGADPRIAYSCHYCGLCQEVCPKDLHAGELCLAERRRLVKEGKGPLPQHRGIQSYVRWGTSPTFTLSRPDPATGEAARVFFPGCSLPGYHPHLVAAAYRHLRERLPGTGIMLNCCGAPVILTGEAEWFHDILDSLRRGLARLGAQEVICACTHCLEVFRRHLPEIPALSLYEVLLKCGLPEIAPAPMGVFHVHDACGARRLPEIHRAVRQLVNRLGHRLEEMPHHGPTSICCGAGGMVPAVDPDLARRMTEFRLSEARHDLVTYCASCRAVFARAGWPALHLLELVFNHRWPALRSAKPAGSLSRWWRRWRLKRQLA